MIRHNTEFRRKSPLKRGLEALRRIARGWEELLPGAVSRSAVAGKSAPAGATHRAPPATMRERLRATSDWVATRPDR